ncbi:hypothetical protein L484_023108 [Morus notabilis]|uniref:Uncharacterized protein n=1 Tax=Morus notabilis TaxID=981085 RepID=W9RLR2_9ROSA|nr:hypothetical protein L484_023108 [Morus notabilis]
METNQFIGDIEFYWVMYTNHKTKQWCNPQGEQDYFSCGAQSENDEVVVELKNKLASYEHKLAACTSVIQQLTSQLNMQFSECFAQFDPRTIFPLPSPPQHPSQDDDDDDDAYRPVISRDPCY